MTLVASDVAVASSIATDTIEHARELVTPLLKEMVNRLDPDNRLVVSYHFGWCDEHGNPTNANPGKAIRPALTLLSAQACGADPHIALPAAAAVELIHNFSLVHDDLMDRDQQRRHRTTVWALWGDATAVLAGDVMLSLAHEVLLECAPAHRTAIQATVASANRELICGQTADTAFEKRNDVTLAECFNMAWGKTAALIAASTVTGAQLADGSPQTRNALGTYGRQLGLAFQLIDDLLGIWGQPTTTGKPVYSDLRSHKKSLPITWTLEHGGPAARELASWLTHPTHSNATDDELRHIAELIEHAGARTWTYQEAHRRTALALKALERANIPQDPINQLHALTHHLINRNT
jgi:geranylgeranyl diphosphate synthase, type I